MTRSGPVAAIDCGTNSTRLIVVAAGGTVLERLMRITRLGKGVDANRRLEPQAVERTLSVLREYRSIMDSLAVVRARVVATSAVRDASNAEAFMGPAALITGVMPEVLSGDEEGLLSFRGATSHLPPEVQRRGSVLVVDIGGGSTELTIGTIREDPSPEDPGRRALATRSLDIGCVRVSERFLRHDPPRPDELAAARAFVSEQVISARDVLPSVPPSGVLVGLAGTVSTIASLAGGIAVYDRARIHHAVLWRDEVERWVTVLSSETSRERLARPGMVEGREDVIVGGVLILAVVMEAFDCERCLVSEDDILDGLAATLLATG
jgi:exopolyphosphatase / guanosine-5'-triphosphate,3'-diphosphate pyrophosphatase